MFYPVNKTMTVNNSYTIFYGEYDTGSEQTLAACLNDASRTSTEPSGS
jgi:hypothetical protein